MALLNSCVKLKCLNTHPRIYIENLEGVLVHIVLACLQRTPSFAAVWEKDLRAGVSPVHADEGEWNAHNFGVHVVLQRLHILIWNTQCGSSSHVIV